MTKQVISARIPVLIGENYQHVMAFARMVEEDDGNVTITMTTQGNEGQELLSWLSGGAPVALTVVAIPVTPHIPRPPKERP